MKFSSLSWKDLLYALSLLVGLAVAWGSLSAKVSALEANVKEVSSVKEDIAVLNTIAKINASNIKELQKDIKTVLSRLPRGCVESNQQLPQASKRLSSVQLRDQKN